MIHPTADVQSQNIGKGTNIWQFVVVLPNAQIGENTNICAHCFIENNVVIGNDVTIKCGVQIWDGCSIEDKVFIGPNVTFTNDIFPRSKQDFELKKRSYKKVLPSVPTLLFWVGLLLDNTPWLEPVVL